LIYPFWPSMIIHIALYREDFLKSLPPDAKLLELASGHGVMSLLAAETGADIQVTGLDISPPAVAVSNRMLGIFGHGHV
jgi:methylase of polypeptide subunit release factors